MFQEDLELHVAPEAEEVKDFQERRNALFEMYGIPSPAIGRNVKIFISEFGAVLAMYETTVTGTSCNGRMVQLFIQPIVHSVTFHSQRICSLETVDEGSDFGETGWVAVVQSQILKRNNRMLQSHIKNFAEFVDVGTRGGREGLQELSTDLLERCRDMQELHTYFEKGITEEFMEDLETKKGTYYVNEIEDITEDQIEYREVQFQVHVLFEG